MNHSLSLTKLLALGLSFSGCRNLDKFDTEKGTAYCGELVSEKYASEGFEYWTEQLETLKLSFTLDTKKLNTLPGKLRSNDAAFGPCTPEPLFDDAPIRVIERALGDRLANISLGDDHEEEVLAFVDSTCSGSMLAVLSLVQNGEAELRLLRPAPEIRIPVADQPRFGVFTLTKQELTAKTGCDF